MTSLYLENDGRWTMHRYRDSLTKFGNVLLQRAVMRYTSLKFEDIKEIKLTVNGEEISFDKMLGALKDEIDGIVARKLARYLKSNVEDVTRIFQNSIEKVITENFKDSGLAKTIERLDPEFWDY